MFAFVAYLLQFPVVLGNIGGWLPVPPVVIFPPLVGLVNTRVENRGLEGLGLIFPHPLRSLILGLILTAFKALGYLHIFTLTGISFSFPAFNATVAVEFIKEFVIAVFILAMWEEIVSRGYIQTRLQEVWGFPGMLVSAGMFASLHIPSAYLEFGYEPKMVLLNFLEMLLPGLMLSYIYWVRRSTLTTIAVHGLGNFLFVIAVSYSGLDARGLHQIRPGIQILWSMGGILLAVLLTHRLFPGEEEGYKLRGFKVVGSRD